MALPWNLSVIPWKRTEQIRQKYNHTLFSSMAPHNICKCIVLIKLICQIYFHHLKNSNKALISQIYLIYNIWMMKGLYATKMNLWFLWGKESINGCTWVQVSYVSLIQFSLNHPGLGWLYVFSSFPPGPSRPPPQGLLRLTSKLLELNLRYLRQSDIGLGKCSGWQLHDLDPSSRLWH